MEWGELVLKSGIFDFFISSEDVELFKKMEDELFGYQKVNFVQFWIFGRKNLNFLKIWKEALSTSIVIILAHS